MNAVSAFLLATALVSGAGIIIKLPALRKERDSFVVPHLIGALASQMAGSILALPPVYMRFDRFVGVPNLSYWGYHALWLCGLYHLLAIAMAMACVPVDQRARYVSLIRIGCIVVVVVMLGFVLAGGGPETPVILTQERALTAVVQLVANSILLLPFTYLLWTALRCAPHTRPGIAKGLIVIAAGAAIADVDGLINMAIPVVHFLSLPGFIVLQQAGEALYPVGTGVMVVGVVLPSLDVAHSYRCFVHWRALRALWEHLHMAQPEIVLHCSGDAPWRVRSAADFEFRLYRRVIEIHDGMLPLRPFLSASDEQAARNQGVKDGLRGLDLDVHVTAALLRQALARQAAGLQCDNHSDDQPVDEPLPLGCLTTPPGGGDDLQSEVSWLRLVARAYADRAPVAAAAIPS